MHIKKIYSDSSASRKPEAAKRRKLEVKSRTSCFYLLWTFRPKSKSLHHIQNAIVILKYCILICVYVV